MREAFYIGHLEKIYSQLDGLTQRMGSFSHVLQEIVGKELMRGQALHKVLMDKKVFTDEELKAALEKLVAESKAELEKLEKEAKEAKQKAIEILVPAGARTAPPAEAPTPVVSPATLEALEKSEPSIPVEKKDDVSSVPPAADA